jgi:hypothetical protein
MAAPLPMFSALAACCWVSPAYRQRNRTATPRSDESRRRLQKAIYCFKGFSDPYASHYLPICADSFMESATLRDSSANSKGFCKNASTP